MTDPDQSSCSRRFAKTDVVATAEYAAHIRRELSDWLRCHFTLDPIRVSDMVLAVNEAMANAAEFAYLTAQRPGVMHVTADHDVSAAVLTVTVADEGRWRVAGEELASISRGRGIPLMHALADNASIDASPNGTQVRLKWDHVVAMPVGTDRVTHT